jgi:hypothetical protein
VCHLILVISLAAAMVGCGADTPSVEEADGALTADAGDEAAPETPEGSTPGPTPETPAPTPDAPEATESGRDSLSTDAAASSKETGNEAASAPTEPSPTPTASDNDETDPEHTDSDTGTNTTEVPQDLLDAMKADLAERLGIATSEIDAVSGRAVTWSDGSLDCPEPGQSYTQALVDGYHVILAARGKEYDYRSDGTRYFKLCQNPSRSGSGGAADR